MSPWEKSGLKTAVWTGVETASVLARSLWMADEEFESLCGLTHIWLKSRKTYSDNGDFITEVKYYDGLTYYTVVVESVDCRDWYKHDVVSIKFRFKKDETFRNLVLNGQEIREAMDLRSMPKWLERKAKRKGVEFRRPLGLLKKIKGKIE
jgi:hypothetical protein